MKKNEKNETPAIITDIAGETAEKFQMLLNSSPSKSDIKVNQFANGAEYIPVSVIQNRLDEVYRGLWSMTSTIQLIANAVVCNLTLKVYHPTGCWIERTGIGAKAIEVTKGASPTDFTSVTSKALEKGAPAAKAEALKNAAKSLGVYFGRNLNVEDVEYKPISEQLSEGTKEEALALLNTSTIPDDKKEKWTQMIKKANPKALLVAITHLREKQRHD